MLNYYKGITDKALFIMDVQKDNGTLAVTFADGSVRYFNDTENTREKINQVREKQIKKILKKYNSKKMKKQYKEKQENISFKYVQKFIIILIIKNIIFWFVKIPSGLVDIIVKSVIPCAIIWTILKFLAKKELEKLATLQSQIEEVEKLELFEEEESKINGFIQEKTNSVVEEHLKSSNISLTEAENIKIQAKLSIYDLDKITLQQLKKFLLELEIEQTMGINYQEQSSDFEQTGYQKSKRT